MSKFVFKHIDHCDQKDAFYQDLQCSWQGVYFHGKAESFVYQTTQEKLAELDISSAADLLYCETKPPLKEGIFEAEVYGEKATLFFWRKPDGQPRGLVVLDSDQECKQDALSKYSQRANFI